MNDITYKVKPAVDACSLNPSTKEEEGGRTLSSEQSGLQSAFQYCQGYTERSCLE